MVFTNIGTMDTQELLGQQWKDILHLALLCYWIECTTINLSLSVPALGRNFIDVWQLGAYFYMLRFEQNSFD